jgi:hypothetical protein
MKMPGSPMIARTVAILRRAVDSFRTGNDTGAGSDHGCAP